MIRLLAQEGDRLLGAPGYSQDSLELEHRSERPGELGGLRGPGEKEAFGCQKRGPAEELGKAADRSDGGYIETCLIQIARAGLLDASVLDGDAADCVLQEGGALSARLEQGHGDVWTSYGKRDPGQAGARANVNNSSAMRN